MWYKKDAGYWHNPTWLSMPWASALVFDYLLADCKMFGNRDGRVSLTHWKPEVVLHVMRLPVSVEDIRKAMDALEACGKVVVSEGEVTVAEWKEYQTDPTNADRQKRHRETTKIRTVSNSAGTDDNSYVTHSNASVTLRTVNNGEIERIERSEREEGGSGGEGREKSQREEHASTASLSLGFEEPDRTPDQDDAHQIPPDASPRLLAIVEAMKRVEFVVPGRGMETIWKNHKLPMQMAVKLETACPAVNIPALIENLAGWTVANPSRAKLNLGKFVWNAATRNQDEPRSVARVESTNKAAWEIEGERIQRQWDEKHGQKH